MRVRFLSNEAIASAANVLLRLDFKDELEQEIDIVEICSRHFGLSIHFVELKPAYGDDVLGMIISEHKVILCDSSIEPIGEHKERKERILRFTLAHELGHYLFHQDYMDSKADAIFYTNLKDKDKDRIELQANIFASMLLMPERLFARAYELFLTEDIDRETLEVRLSELFNVSREAAKYRLQALEKEVA